MKKLMLAVGAAVCAASLQAATVYWNWSVATAGTQAYDGSSAVLGSTTAYHFFGYASADAANAAKTALVESLFGGGSISGFEDSVMLSAAGKSEAREITREDVSTKLYGFVAVLATDSDGGKWVYTSGNKNGKGLEVGASALGYSLGSTTLYEMDGTALNANTSGTGWHQYGAKSGGGSEIIPEPTSGLLLLLGVAGMMLRRKAK